jgi:hypothetical protein
MINTRAERRLPPKVMGEYPGMGPVEKLEADFRRLAADCRAIHARHGHEKTDGMALAYIAAAEKVRRLRCVLMDNTQIIGGTSDESKQLKEIE